MGCGGVHLKFQGSKLTVASSKFAIEKFHLPPVKHVGSKMLPPGNSVREVIFWNSKLIFTEKILMFIRQNAIPYGQRHYQYL